MQLILVRHAQPVEERLTDGSIADPGLSDVGRWQAARVSQWLAHEPIDAVISSPKARALETITELATTLDLPVQIEPELDEIDRGASVYLPTERLATDGGDYWQAVIEQRWADIGWDSPEAFAERIGRAYQAIVDRRPGQRVVISAHGGTIRYMLGHALGLANGSWLVSDYASICRLQIADDGAARVYSINETAHFDADGRTLHGVMRAGTAPGAAALHQ